MAGNVIRWGLLSTARINDRVIGPMRASDRSELAAVASRTDEKASAHAAKHEIPTAYGTYDALLADPNIDAVYISTPNALHAEWAIRAADAGKHILCEKPLAMTPTEVDAMSEAASRNGVVLQEAVMYRYAPQTAKVRELVRDGVIGDVRLVRGDLMFRLVGDSDFRLTPSMGGGTTWDNGSYPISFCRTVLDAEPVEVQARHEIGPSGVDVSFAGQMTFPGDTVAQVSSSFNGVRLWEAQIVGTEGIIHLDSPWLVNVGAPAHLTILHGGRRGPVREGIRATDTSEEIITFDGHDAYLDEIHSMEACILDGASLTVSHEESRGNIAAILAMYESSRSGKVVRL